MDLVLIEIKEVKYASEKQLNIQSWMKQKCNRDVVCAVSLPIILSRLITSLQIANKRSDETR